nr:hypothetical protein [uncultured Kingella sp.]
MGTFFRAIIALIAAAFLGLGALLLVGFGVCTLLLAVGGDTASFGVGAVVGIIAALAFGIRVFVSVFNALGDDKPQPNSEENSPTPALPHDGHDQQREQANHDNAN